MRIAACLAVSFLCLHNSAVVADQPVYTRDIQPIFAEKCFNCHGPDKNEGGLRLHESKSAFAELESGDFAIVPGAKDKGTLLARISAHDGSERMPPEGDPLKKEEIETIRKWIEAGAKYDTHWAYVPVKRPELPTVKNNNWCNNEIDHFVLKLLESKGIQPSDEANKHVLIKRLYFDLLGLLPSPEHVERFVNSKDPNAYEKLVDELLSSRHFGERWGRHWLDKARYADSDGYEKDRPRPNAWRYRDWVINAVNQDIPFDQFTIEQLAGDLIPNASSMQKLATAFHRQTLTNTEGGTDQEQFRVEATFDRTETVGSVWMGLTLTCARCHTHKYDQITQREYYELYSFFNDANESNTSVPRSQDDVDRYETQFADHLARLKVLESQLGKAIEKVKPEVDKWFAAEVRKSASKEPVQFHEASVYQNKILSGAKIDPDGKGAWTVSGKVPDKDEYTLYIESPITSVTGIRLTVLADPKLPGKGPGRASNGNFVLTHVRMYKGFDRQFKKHQRLELVSAEADFSQNQFSPQGALSEKPKSGWAIAPRMGKQHSVTFFLRQPIKVDKEQFLQVVLDQKYGGQHVIGKFRLELMTGYDPLRSLPKEIADIVRSGKLDPKKRSQVEQYLAKNHAATKSLWAEVDKLKKNAPKSPEMSVRVIVPAKRTTKVLHRGDFLQPGDEVSPQVIEVVRNSHALPDVAKESRSDRLAFAKWLVHPDHPLTGRVTVNQVWFHLFGNGLVPTLNDFGVRGELPTHPELLDWLAWNYPREMKWSRKQLIKKIVMSATYRQSSKHRPELNEKDPSNRWLARQNRVRVPAEIIRDLYLAASGLLSQKIGGPSVFPPLPPGVADLSYANNFKWKTSQGEDRYRRGMYTFFKRTSPHPNLISFDCPDANTSNIKRDQSNTPIQALVTLNNIVFVESAQAMAKRILESKVQGDRKRVQLALRICVVRNPSESEVDRFVVLFEKYRTYFEKHQDQAKKLASNHAVASVPVEINAAWVATLRMIMNLDEFIVRE